MKIVFVQPRSFHTWEALGIGYLASRLRAEGYADLAFFSGFFDSDEEIIQGCRDADVVGFSCTSPQMRHALHLAAQIKRPHNYIVFGGVHPSALPEETLKHACVDAVVLGEGEEAFLGIVRGNRDRLVKCRYVEDLDALPFPDRQLIRQERNIQQAYRDNGERIASILAGRGCPFGCVFCASHQVWSRRARFRSPECILDEFETVVKGLGIDFVKFSDDTFAIRQELVTRFCEEKLKRGLSTPWGCNIRVDTVGEETLRLMRRAGCREVWIGVESGSPRILEDMKKGITVEQIRRTFGVTKEIGLLRRAYILLGMPNESPRDIVLTESLIDAIQPDSVGFTILAPYPGTVVYNPDVHADVDWSLVDEYENGLTSTRYFSNEDLHQEQRRLVAKYRDSVVFRHRERLSS